MKRSSMMIIAIGIIVVIGAIFFATRSQSPTSQTTPTPVATKATLSSLTADEEKQILTASTEIVKANTEDGYVYTLAIKKHVDNYVRVDVTPAEGEMIDPAQVILEKQDGTWKATSFGTAFPELYDKVPALFE